MLSNESIEKLAIGAKAQVQQNTAQLSHLTQEKAEKINRRTANLVDNTDADYKLLWQISETTGVGNVSTSYNTTGFIAVQQTKVYTFKGFGTNITNPVGFRSATFYNSSKTFISGVGGSTQTIYQFTVPANTSYVRISYNIGFTSVSLVLGSVQPTVYDTYFDIYDNKFTERNICSFGTSIMLGTGNKNIGIRDLIAARYGMTGNDYAVGGATVGVIEGTNNHIGNQIVTAIVASENPDIIIFDGLANDVSGTSTPNVPLGEITDGYSATLDKSTFYGAFENICKQLVYNFPNAKKIFIRVHNMGSRYLPTQISYGEAAIIVCKKWGVDYVDIFGRLTTWLSWMRDAYTTDTSAVGHGDSTHPNLMGYEEWYIPTVVSKMSEILT